MRSDSPRHFGPPNCIESTEMPFRFGFLILAILLLGTDASALRTFRAVQAKVAADHRARMEYDRRLEEARIRQKLAQGRANFFHFSEEREYRWFFTQDGEYLPAERPRMTWTGDAYKYEELRPFLDSGYADGIWHDGNNTLFPDLPEAKKVQNNLVAGKHYIEIIQDHLRHEPALVRRFYGGAWDSENMAEATGGWKMFDPAHWTPELTRFQEDERKNLFQWMRENGVRTLLEAGAGFGTYLADAVRRDMNYVGYEIVPWMAQLGKERIRALRSMATRSPRTVEMHHADAFDRASARPRTDKDSSVLLLPFNLFGNLPDPVAAARAIRERGSHVALSVYGTDNASTAARVAYYRKCGYKDVQPFWTDFGVLITSRDGLHSYAYHSNFLRWVFKEAFGEDLEVEVRQNGGIGLTYFFRTKGEPPRRQSSIQKRPSKVKGSLSELSGIPADRISVNLLEIDTAALYGSDEAPRPPRFHELTGTKLVSLGPDEAVVSVDVPPKPGSLIRLVARAAESEIAVAGRVQNISHHLVTVKFVGKSSLR